MNIHANRFTDPLLWPVESLHIKDTSIFLTIHQFPGRPTDPTVIMLPDAVTDARACFTGYLAHPLVAPLMEQCNLVLVNFPNQAAPSDYESYEDDHKGAMSYLELARTMAAGVSIIKHTFRQSPTVVGFGVGLGAALLSSITTHRPDLFSALVLVSPPALHEPIADRSMLVVAGLTRTQEQSTSTCPASLVARWRRRWFNPPGLCRLQQSTVDTVVSSFDIRRPVFTCRLLETYFGRPSDTVHVTVPTLVFMGTDLPSDYAARGLDAAFSDLMLIPLRGRGLAHLESPRDTVLHLLMLFRTLGTSVDLPRSILQSAELDIKTLLPTTARAVRAVVRLKMHGRHAAKKAEYQQFGGHFAMQQTQVDSDRSLA